MNGQTKRILRIISPWTKGSPLSSTAEFSAFYERTHLSLFRYLYGLTGGPQEEVEDLTAEAFTRAWRSRHSFDGGEPADLLLLAAEPHVELAIEPGELGDLGGGPVHGFALLLEGRGLVRDLLSQRLEHGQLVLHAWNRLRGLAHGLERPLGRLDPALQLLELAGGLDLLAPQIQVPLGRAAARAPARRPGTAVRLDVSRRSSTGRSG